ncbi:hypothetical protein [Flavobacterium sp. H122]|uniref:hypothetical protein n=1 Tax=Flavobacterium sp. H122 TaxID=2529860 RepID=UPI0010AA2958|nr:hypothetical protein [Flavobacterium sp. H122]
MKKKIKDYSFQFIKEIIPVIAGILIALFIDNWNSERKDKIFVNQVYSTISNELKESKNDINAIIPQQDSLITVLELNSNDKKTTILDIVMKSKGIYIPQIKTNAWKSVSNTKIDLIDFKKIISLSNIDELKETLKNKTVYLMNFLYSNIHKTDKENKQTLKMLLMDIMQTEKSLLQNIEAYEKH